MKILLPLIAVGALIGLITSGRAAPPIPPIFVPVIVVYENGSFKTVALTGDEWFSSLQECKGPAEQEAMKVLETDKNPGLSVRVSCLPVPSKNPLQDVVK